jgi:hypothetical protein
VTAGPDRRALPGHGRSAHGPGLYQNTVTHFAPDGDQPDHQWTGIFNDARKVAFSRTLKTADWANTLRPAFVEPSMGEVVPEPVREHPDAALAPPRGDELVDQLAVIGSRLLIPSRSRSGGPGRAGRCLSCDA